MRLRLLQRKLSISAPQMRVSAHWPWPVVLAVIGGGLCLFGWIVWEIAQPGPVTISPHLSGTSSETVALERRVKELETQISELQEQLGRADGLRRLDQTAQTELTKAFRALETENVRLKDDLAFFEGFIPGDGVAGLSIRRFQCQKDTLPGLWKYRALISKGGDNKEQSFRYQVAVKLTQNGRSDLIVVPATDDSPDHKIAVKRFARVEGSLQLPADAVVQSVEFRLLDKTTIRAQNLLKM